MATSPDPVFSVPEFAKTIRAAFPRLFEVLPRAQDAYPIRPTDWTLIFDGKTISFHPSIGNWSFACQSHYYIRKNRVKWVPKWSREQIERGRDFDDHPKERYFGTDAILADCVAENSRCELSVEM